MRKLIYCSMFNLLLLFLIAPVQAETDILEEHLSLRASAALIRSRTAVDRGFVAIARIVAELESVGLNVSEDVHLQAPGPLEFQRPVNHKQLVALASYVHENLKTARAIRRISEQIMRPYRPVKPRMLGVPEWADKTVNRFPPPNAVNRSPKNLLHYIENGAFYTEQAIQVSEILEEQAITYANIRLKPLEGKIEGSVSGQRLWRFLGPSVIPEGEGYSGARVPVSGRVTSLAIDPVKTNTVYAGSALGGVWKSANKGKSWKAVSDDQPSLAIGAIATSPVHSGTIYAGTGEANIAFRELVIKGDRQLAGHQGKGMLLSTNGGKTWRLVGEEQFSGAAFAQIAVSHSNPSMILAATTKGLFRSLDKGVTWKRMAGSVPDNSPQIMATSVAAHPGNPRRAIAAFWGMGVYHTDGLESSRPRWRRLTYGLPLSNIGRVEVCYAPSNPDVLYALYSTADNFLRGLYISTNGGSSWRQIPGVPDILQGQGFYNMLLAVSPLSPYRVYIGGAGDRNKLLSSFYRAEKVGRTWRFYPIGRELHIDFHDLVFDPRISGRAYVSNDGGVWRTENEGESWQSCNDGLAITQIIQIDQHPESADFIVAGTQDNGTLIYERGKGWKHADDGDGGTVAIDPQDTNTIYSEFISHKLARSKEKGKYGSFRPIFPDVRGRSAFLAPFDLNPDNSKEIALGADFLYLSQDGGDSWEKIEFNFTQRGHTHKVKVISDVLFASHDRLYVATSNGAVWRADREKRKWGIRKIYDTAGKYGKAGYVSALAAPEKDPDRLYFAVTWKIHSSLIRYDALATTRHRTRVLIENEAPGGDQIGIIHSLAVDPRNLAILYLGGERGVHRSADGGRTWHPLGRGLPKTAVFAVQPHPAIPLLRVGTFGRGVWEIDTAAESEDVL